jgi:hypothetical protein
VARTAGRGADRTRCVPVSAFEDWLVAGPRVKELRGLSAVADFCQEADRSTLAHNCSDPGGGGSAQSPTCPTDPARCHRAPSPRPDCRRTRPAEQAASAAGDGHGRCGRHTRTSSCNCPILCGLEARPPHTVANTGTTGAYATPRPEQQRAPSRSWLGARVAHGFRISGRRGGHRRPSHGCASSCSTSSRGSGCAPCAAWRRPRSPNATHKSVD